jgi:hypothetical protein
MGILVESGAFEDLDEGKEFDVESSTKRVWERE